MILGEDPITIHRASGPGNVYVDGVFQPPARVMIETRASIQPLNGKELQLLPEGRRTKNTAKAFLEIEVFAGAPEQADIIEHEGTMFEVHRVDRWHRVIPHFEATLIEVESGNA